MSENTESLHIELDDCWNRIGVWSREYCELPGTQALHSLP